MVGSTPQNSLQSSAASMNNSDFRSLVSGGSNRSGSKQGSAGTITSSATTTSRPGAFFKPRSLKSSSSDPFARGNGSGHSVDEPPRKKFKSSNVKGARLAAGYQDRAQQRKKQEEEENEKERRIKALEEQMKLGQIDAATFEKLRDEIAGGDLGATHLVKGLDRKLLERVRRGEDVFESGTGGGEDLANSRGDTADGSDDEAFADLERAEIAPVKREAVEKKGELAPSAGHAPSTQGVKRPRAEILADFRAQRKAQEEAQAAADAKQKGRWKQNQLPGTSRLERDAKGREVLITVDENGVVKRKVRKVAAPSPPTVAEPVLEPVTESLPEPAAEEQNVSTVEQEQIEQVSEKVRRKKKRRLLGDDVNSVSITELSQAERAESPTVNKEESDDEDIFQGVGDDYDPLAGLEVEEDEEDDNVDAATKLSEKGASAEVESDDSHDTNSDAASEDGETSDIEVAIAAKQSAAGPQPPPKRNYFSSTPNAPATTQDPQAKYRDPELLAALKRASDISKREEAAEAAKQSKSSSAAERLLARRDRDFDDMDMGFGGSREDDEEEGEDSRIKLREWKGTGAGEDEGGGGSGKGGQPRKRGKKKRKGDKNSASDVLRVMEGRKK